MGSKCWLGEKRDSSWLCFREKLSPRWPSWLVCKMQVCWNELNLISLKFLILFHTCHCCGCDPAPPMHPLSPPAQLLMPLSEPLLLICVTSSAPINTVGLHLFPPPHWWTGTYLLWQHGAKPSGVSNRPGWHLCLLSFLHSVILCRCFRSWMHPATVYRPQQLTSAQCLWFQDCKRRPAWELIEHLINASSCTRQNSWACKEGNPF